MRTVWGIPVGQLAPTAIGVTLVRCGQAQVLSSVRSHSRLVVRLLPSIQHNHPNVYVILPQPLRTPRMRKGTWRSRVPDGSHTVDTFTHARLGISQVIVVCNTHQHASYKSHLLYNTISLISEGSASLMNSKSLRLTNNINTVGSPSNVCHVWTSRCGTHAKAMQIDLSIKKSFISLYPLTISPPNIYYIQDH